MSARLAVASILGLIPWLDSPSASPRQAVHANRWRCSHVFVRSCAGVRPGIRMRLALLVSLCAVTSTAAPNVLFVLIDDLGYGTFEHTATLT